MLQIGHADLKDDIATVVKKMELLLSILGKFKVTI